MTTTQTDRRNRTVLGADCRMKGELELNNDALIMGQFEGTLRVAGELELAPGASVTGTIITGSLKLAGTLHANVQAEESVELLSDARLIGDIQTSRLIVAEGAEIEGHVAVGRGSQAQPTISNEVSVEATTKPEPEPEQADTTDAIDEYADANSVPEVTKPTAPEVVVTTATQPEFATPTVESQASQKNRENASAVETATEQAESAQAESQPGELTPEQKAAAEAELQRRIAMRRAEARARLEQVTSSPSATVNPEQDPAIATLNESIRKMLKSRRPAKPLELNGSMEASDNPQQSVLVVEE